MARRDGRAEGPSKDSATKVKKGKPVRKEKWSLRRVFKEIDFTYVDETAARYRRTTRGANGYKVSALFTTLLFMQLRGIESILDLARFLERHPEWVRFLGLCRTVDGKLVYKSPDRSTFYRLPQRLDVESSVEILTQMAMRLMEGGIIKGESVSVDATIIRAYYKDKKGKKRKRRRSRDRDAAWGYDAYRETFVYGYKVHILLDVDTALPIGVMVTNAKYGENRTVAPFVELLESRYTQVKVEEFYADAGYDGNKTRLTIVKDLHATPYIALNPRNCKGESEEEKMARRKKLCEKFYRRNFIHEYWVDPDTDAYKERFARRTFSEQAFSVSKGTLKLDGFRHRGIGWATMHAVIACVSMLAVARTAVAVGRPDLARCIMCFNGT